MTCDAQTLLSGGLTGLTHRQLVGMKCVLMNQIGSNKSVSQLLSDSSAWQSTGGWLRKAAMIQTLCDTKDEL